VFFERGELKVLLGRRKGWREREKGHWVNEGKSKKGDGELASYYEKSNVYCSFES